MANEAYVYRIRTDLGAGAHQITDLLPNTSRRAFSYQAYPQSGYIPAYRENDTIVGNTAANVTTAALSGLGPYIGAVTNDEASGNQISEANADAAALAIIALLDAGAAVTETALNNILVTTLGMGANTMPFPTNVLGSVAGQASIGTQANLMKVATGGSYTLPAGSTYNTAAPIAADNGSFDDDGWRQMYQSGSFTISATVGDIAHYAAATYTYVAVTGAAVAAYNVDGSVVS